VDHRKRARASRGLIPVNAYMREQTAVRGAPPMDDQKATFKVRGNHYIIHLTGQRFFAKKGKKMRLSRHPGKFYLHRKFFLVFE
jgi:hypothetical protein